MKESNLKKALNEAMSQDWGNKVGQEVYFNRERVKMYNTVIPFAGESGIIQSVEGNGLKVETSDGFEVFVYFDDADNFISNRGEGSDVAN
jgi:hypothetical protein